jgi:hypothetical protein
MWGWIEPGKSCDHLPRPHSIEISFHCGYVGDITSSKVSDSPGYLTFTFARDLPVNKETISLFTLKLTVVDPA